MKLFIPPIRPFTQTDARTSDNPTETSAEVLFTFLCVTPQTCYCWLSSHQSMKGFSLMAGVFERKENKATFEATRGSVGAAASLL